MAPVTLESQSVTQSHGVNEANKISKLSSMLLKVDHIDVLLSGGIELEADGLKYVLLHKSVKLGIRSSANQIELIALRP